MQLTSVKDVDGIVVRTNGWPDREKAVEEARRFWKGEVPFSPSTLADIETGGRVGHGLVEDQIKSLVLSQNLGLAETLLIQRVARSLGGGLRGGSGSRLGLVLVGGLEEGRHVGSCVVVWSWGLLSRVVSEQRKEKERGVVAGFYKGGVDLGHVLPSWEQVLKLILTAGLRATKGRNEGRERVLRSLPFWAHIQLARALKIRSTVLFLVIHVIHRYLFLDVKVQTYLQHNGLNGV